jgi:hypothetical protein
MTAGPSDEADPKGPEVLDGSRAFHAVHGPTASGATPVHQSRQPLCGRASTNAGTKALARGPAPGRCLGLVVVCPCSLLHAPHHEPFATEERDLGAVGSSQDQHLWVQVCVVSGRDVKVWLSFLARFSHNLMIATHGRSGFPNMGHLFLRNLSYERPMPSSVLKARRNVAMGAPWRVAARVSSLHHSEGELGQHLLSFSLLKHFDAVEQLGPATSRSWCLAGDLPLVYPALERLVVR